MVLKQIPFSLEMVKKIQAGEVKGTIKTRDGRAARFLGEIKDDMYPLVFARKIKNSEKELLDVYTLTGKYSIAYDSSEYDIILEIEDEQKKTEHRFKPFDKVLGRNGDNRTWEPDFFASYHQRLGSYTYWCIGGVYIQCIPYEGNEHLLGTTNKPKENKL